MLFLPAVRNNACLIAAALMLISCAGQRSPDGGPVDSEPPVIVSTNPPNYTTHFRNSSITVEFSEYVDHRTLEGAVFTSPSLGVLEFDWSGREVEIRFSENLRRNTTYVMTLGTDVADLNNHNKMVQAYSLAFSTGDDIDHGAISGRVFPVKDSDSPLGVMVFAYKLQDLNSDTLNPSVTKPDYVTQTGKSGEFVLRHLSFGRYRVFAIRDDYKNLLYDPEADDYGAASYDFNLTPTDTLRSDVWLKLAKEDTTALRLIKVGPVNQRHVLAEFSSAVDAGSVKPGEFRVSDTSGNSSLRILSVFPANSKLTSLVVVTDSQMARAVYRFSADSIRGTNGLRINQTASTLLFTSSEVRDTLPLGIQSMSIADTSKNIDLHPSLSLQFSDAVEKGSAENAILLSDSSRNAVPIAFRWLSDAAVEFGPKDRLASLRWYVCKVNMRNISDLFGKRGRDSSKVFRFQTIDEELFSSIEGTVTDFDTTDRKGDLIILARNVARQGSKEYVIRQKDNGAFALREIIEGRYLLFCYRDRNDNAKYDGGLVHPYHPSERFVQYPDTLKVRARWPLEGVELKLR